MLLVPWITSETISSLLHRVLRSTISFWDTLFSTTYSAQQLSFVFLRLRSNQIAIGSSERRGIKKTTRDVFLLISENLLNDNSYSSLNFIFPLVLCNNSLRGCEERWSIEVVNWSCFGVTGKHIEGFEGLKEKIVVEEEKGVD